jgi:WD40 repeat protein/serine/threonine protein kinase
MEPVQATCSGCGLQAKVPPTAIGKTVRCPRCGTRFAVAADVAVAPAEEPVSLSRAATAPLAGPAPTDAAVPPVVPPPVPVPDGPAPTVWEEMPNAPRPTELEEPTAPRAPVPLAATREWQVGDVVLDLYEVTGVLGEGGMGRVYRVRHRGWDVDLAVKTPLATVLQAAGGADNFEREAETWVNLGLHPHTVSCYYVRRVDGVPRVFAEFVDGGSLYEWIRDGRLRAVDQILDVAIQFAWGLHYAHDQGLVHRDVKPANLMLTADGAAKVTDFGLTRARAVGEGALGDGRAGQTLMVAGGLGGTPAYMSPEQSAARDLTRRTDLWSWALCVLEMFQGQRSWEFGVAAPEVLRAYLAQGSIVPGLPPMPPLVSDLLKRCFLEDPDARPRSLWEAATVLYTAYEAATGHAYPRSEPQAGKDTADSLNNRAVSLLDLGREAEADPLWGRALRSQPHHLEATYNQALRDWQAGRASDEEMLTRMGEAGKTHAASPRVRHLMGRLHFAVGDYGPAARAFEEAVNAGVRSTEVYRELGFALCAQGASTPDTTPWVRAMECLASALQAGGEDPAEIAGYALSLVRLGQEDKGRGLYRQAAQQRRGLPVDLESAVARFLPGHEAGVSLKGLPHAAVGLALTPDGRRVFATDGESVRSWEAESGALQRTLAVREVKLKTIAITPDGARMVWGGDGAPPQVVDLETGRPVLSFQRHPGFVSAICIAPDGRRALAGGSDRVVRLWDLETGQLVQPLAGHREAVTCVAISADGATGASGSLDGTVRLWDLEEGREVCVFEGHRGRVHAVLFAGPPGDVVSAGEDRALHLWDGWGRRPRATLAGHGHVVTSLAALEEGRVVVSGSLDRTVRSWDVANARLLSVCRVEAGVQALARGGDHRLWVAQGNALTSLRLPERARLPPPAVARPVSAVESERRDATFLGCLEEAQESLRLGDVAQSLRLARSARSIPGYERSEAALTLWDEICALLPRKGLQSAWEEGSLEGHADPVLCLAVSADGGRALSGSMDGTVRLWDLGARQLLSVLEGHESTVSSVAFSADGRRAISGSWDRTLRVWDLASGRVERTMTGHAEYVSGLALSPDGTHVLSASWDQTLRLWELSSGREVGVLAGHSSNASAVVFGPDGRFAVSVGWDATARAWDVESRQCVSVLEGHQNNLGAVCLTPSGRQVVTAGVDRDIKLWDLKARRVLRQFPGHEAEVTALAFTPDGRHLISGARDKTVRVWEVASGKCERVLSHTAAVLAVALTPGGSGLLSAVADRTLRLWHLDWEPEERALPAWDEKARPFLESFVSLRFKPETVRTRAPWTEDEVDVLVEQMRHRGFGGLRKEAVAGRLRDLTEHAGEAPSFWDEVRQAAPRGGPAKASPTPRAIPWLPIGLVAAVLLAVAAAAYPWFRPAPKPRLVPHHAEFIRAHLDAYDLTAFAQDCSATGQYELVQQALAPEVMPATLACLAGMRDPGMLIPYLDGIVLNDADPVKAARHRRGAVALLVGLGEPAIDALCLALEHPRPEVRSLVARALAESTSPRARTCLGAGALNPLPGAREAVAEALPVSLARGQIEPGPGWEMATRLLGDPEAAVRLRAAGLLNVFHPDLALAAAERLALDGDPAVAAAGQRAIGEVQANIRHEKLLGR